MQVSMADESNTTSSSGLSAKDDETKKRKYDCVVAERVNAVLTRNVSLSTNYTFKVEIDMLLIPFADFKSFGAIPRSSDRGSLNIVTYDELMDKRADCLITFISHQWLSPTLDPKDMHPDRETCKYDTICDGFNSLLSGLEIAESNVYLWIDFCCVEQDDIHQLKAGIRSLPAYIERCDLVFTPYNDALMVERKNEEMIELLSGYNELKHFFSALPSLLQYLSRGWCRLELFLASNCPTPEERFGYFQRLNISTRTDRPHLFYGDYQRTRGELPVVGPRIANTVFTALHPVRGQLTVAADIVALQQLVDLFSVLVPTSDVYTGEMKSLVDGGLPVPHGQGKMDYSIGAVYDGHWENGQWDGYGSYIYVSGTKYTGEWKAGKRHGYGRHVLSNGLVFEGCFHDDSTHGTGKLYYQNGNMKFNGIKVKSNWSGALQGYYPNGRLQYDGNAVDNKWEGKRVEYADTEENDVINTECVSNEDI